MIRTMMKSKIHWARVTESNLHYVGSITIDQMLLEAADIYPNERVQVVNIDNGARLETYTIPGEAGSGIIGINGAAARLIQPGDRVIIISYAMYTVDELRDHRPVVVFVDEGNSPVRVEKSELHGPAPVSQP